jgi:hypothetical protein
MNMLTMGLPSNSLGTSSSNPPVVIKLHYMTLNLFANVENAKMMRKSRCMLGFYQSPSP